MFRHGERQVAGPGIVRSSPIFSKEGLCNMSRAPAVNIPAFSDFSLSLTVTKTISYKNEVSSSWPIPDRVDSDLIPQRNQTPSLSKTLASEASWISPLVMTDIYLTLPPPPRLAVPKCRPFFPLATKSQTMPSRAPDGPLSSIFSLYPSRFLTLPFSAASPVFVLRKAASYLL